MLQWVGRLFQAQALDKWSHVPKNIFAPFGDKHLCFFSNVKSRAFKGLQRITSHFWNCVLKTWLDLNCHDPSMPVSTLLWNNSHIKYQGNGLMFTDWIIGKILYVKDIKGPSGFITFQDICNKIGNCPSRILEYNVVRAAVYTFVHSHNICDTADPELSDRPLFCNRKINTAKDFRKSLIFMHDSVPCANGFWSRKFGLEIDKHNTIISNERNKATGSTVENSVRYISHKPITVQDQSER